EVTALAPRTESAFHPSIERKGLERQPPIATSAALMRLDRNHSGRNFHFRFRGFANEFVSRSTGAGSFRTIRSMTPHPLTTFRCVARSTQDLDIAQRRSLRPLVFGSM